MDRRFTSTSHPLPGGGTTFRSLNIFQHGPQPEFEAGNGFGGVAGQHLAAGRDIERTPAPTADAGFRQPGVVVGHHGVDDDLAVMHFAQFLDRRGGALDLLGSRHHGGAVLQRPAIVLRMGDFEPGARRDLIDITAAGHAAGLCTNLITSAVGITADTLCKLAETGLDHVQISIQDSDPAIADHIAGYEGAFARKRALATEVVRLQVPLTVNAVMGRRGGARR